MSIRKLNLQDRFVTIYSDDSMGIAPADALLDKIIKEANDPNEKDPQRQAKVGRITFQVLEIFHDPTKVGSSVCPHCQKEIAQ